MAVDILKFKQFLIGGHLYRIRYQTSKTIARLMDKYHVSDKNGTDGFYNPDNNTIYVASDISRSGKGVTLLHEILHAIEAILGIDLGEKRVIQLSEAMYAVLKNNGVIR